MSWILVMALILLILACILWIVQLTPYESFPDAKLSKLQNRIAQVIPEAAAVDMKGGNKSFIVNKKQVYICLKDENDQYYSDNMLTYVILHELAHALSKSEQHTPEWEQRFAELLRRAAAAGIYDPAQPIVQDYCEF